MNEGIQYEGKKQTRGWGHAGVITKMAKGKAYVSAHNNNRLNQRLDTYIRSPRGTWANIHRVRPEWY